ncbi:MAG: ABC transporter ATP-binding protein [Chitinivibrionales bacterium]
MVRVELSNLCCGYGKKTVVKGVSLKVGAGESLCILGPNGVGKTTLFRTILGFLKAQEGTIHLEGKDIRYSSRKMIAQTIAYVPQAHTPPFPFSVMDIVLMGRTAHLGAFSSPAHHDREVAEYALEMLGILKLRDRSYTEISGGERQMVLIARAVAQQAKIMILDEPTSNLDFGNQVKVLCRISSLVKHGLSVIMTSHFPNHAFLCSDRVFLMKRGNAFEAGDVDEIVTEENLRDVYGVDVRIVEAPDGRGKMCKACVPVV